MYNDRERDSTEEEGNERGGVRLCAPILTASLSCLDWQCATEAPGRRSHLSMWQWLGLVKPPHPTSPALIALHFLVALPPLYVWQFVCFIICF